MSRAVRDNRQLDCHRRPWYTRHNAHDIRSPRFSRRRHVSRDLCHGLAVQRCSPRVALVSARGVRICLFTSSRGQSRQRSRRLDRRATDRISHSDSTKRKREWRAGARWGEEGLPGSRTVANLVPTSLGGPRGPSGVTVGVRRRMRESRRASRGCLSSQTS